MQRSSLRRALGLGTATALIGFGGAYVVGSTAISTAAPVDEFGRPDVVPAGPATLPTQAADRARQAIDWMWTLIDSRLRSRFRNHPQVRRNLELLSCAVVAGHVTPAAAACQLLNYLETETSKEP